MARYAQFAYSGAFDGSQAADELNSLDSRIEYVVVLDHSFQDMLDSATISNADAEAIMAKSLKYMNTWASDAHDKTGVRDWTSEGYGITWDPGPGGKPAADPSVSDGSRYLHRMSDRHMDWQYCQIVEAVLSDDLPCKGVFLDDYFYRRKYWSGFTGAQKRRMWGPMNGRAGWRTSSDDNTAEGWNKPRHDTLSGRLQQFKLDYGDKDILFNAAGGDTMPALSASQPRLFESVFSSSTMTEAFLRANAKAGDVLLCYFREWNAGSPQWRTVGAADPEVTNGFLSPGQSTSVLYSDAVDLAEELDLVISIGWHSSGSPGSSASNMELPEDWA